MGDNHSNSNVPGYYKNIPERRRSPSLLGPDTSAEMRAGPSYDVDPSAVKKIKKKKKDEKADQKQEEEVIFVDDIEDDVKEEGKDEDNDMDCTNCQSDDNEIVFLELTKGTVPKNYNEIRKNRKRVSQVSASNSIVVDYGHGHRESKDWSRTRAGSGYCDSLNPSSPAQPADKDNMAINKHNHGSGNATGRKENGTAMSNANNNKSASGYAQSADKTYSHGSGSGTGRKENWTAKLKDNTNNNHSTNNGNGFGIFQNVTEPEPRKASTSKASDLAQPPPKGNGTANGSSGSRGKENVNGRPNPEVITIDLDLDVDGELEGRSNSPPVNNLNGNSSGNKPAAAAGPQLLPDERERQRQTERQGRPRSDPIIDIDDDGNILPPPADVDGTTVTDGPSHADASFNNDETRNASPPPENLQNRPETNVIIPIPEGSTLRFVDANGKTLTVVNVEPNDKNKTAGKENSGQATDDGKEHDRHRDRDRDSRPRSRSRDKHRRHSHSRSSCSRSRHHHDRDSDRHRHSKSKSRHRSDRERSRSHRREESSSRNRRGDHWRGFSTSGRDRDRDRDGHHKKHRHYSDTRSGRREFEKSHSTAPFRHPASPPPGKKRPAGSLPVPPLPPPTDAEDIIARMTRCSVAECLSRFFKDRRQGTRHQKNDHDKKFCPVCFTTISCRGNAWKEHITLYHAPLTGEEKAKCPLCPDVLFFEGLYAHVAKCHLIDAEKRMTANFNIWRRGEYQRGGGGGNGDQGSASTNEGQNDGRQEQQENAHNNLLQQPNDSQQPEPQDSLQQQSQSSQRQEQPLNSQQSETSQRQQQGQQTQTQKITQQRQQQSKGFQRQRQRKQFHNSMRQQDQSSTNSLEEQERRRNPADANANVDLYAWVEEGPGPTSGGAINPFAPGTPAQVPDPIRRWRRRRSPPTTRPGMERNDFQEEMDDEN